MKFPCPTLTFQEFFEHSARLLVDFPHYGSSSLGNLFKNLNLIKQLRFGSFYSLILSPSLGILSLHSMPSFLYSHPYLKSPLFPNSEPSSFKQLKLKKVEILILIHIAKNQSYFIRYDFKKI